MSSLGQPATFPGSDRVHSATAGVEDDSHPTRVFCRELEPRMLDGLARGRQRKLVHSHDAAGVLCFHPITRLKISHLAGDLDWKIGRIESLDLASTGDAGLHLVPEGGGIVPQWRDRSESGDDNSLHDT